MTNTTGPARLRQIAEFTILSAAELRQLAAQWEADIARADELGRRLSSKTRALQEAEESIDRLQATKKDLTSEIKELYAARQTLPEWAELERARALLAELEWCGVDYRLECPWCLGTKTEHYGEPAGHKPDCKLAEFLAAASGGAA